MFWPPQQRLYPRVGGPDPPPVIDDSALARGLSLRVLDDVLTVGIPHVDPIGEMR